MNTLKDNANENNSKQITMDAAIQNRHCDGTEENVREIDWRNVRSDPLHANLFLYKYSLLRLVALRKFQNSYKLTGRSIK